MLLRRENTFTKPQISFDDEIKESFLNIREQNYKISIKSLNTLGIINRIVMSISRRGLSLNNLKYEVTPDQKFSFIELKINCNRSQIDSLTNDLNRLVDLDEMHVFC